MKLLFIIGAIWLAGRIFGWWEQRPPPKTSEQLLQEQREREQREREPQARFEQQRIERERQQAERREEWQTAYGKYLESSKWKRVFKRAEYRCEFCGGPAKQVHHECYPKSFGRISYLKAICRDCHRKQHGI